MGGEPGKPTSTPAPPPAPLRVLARLLLPAAGREFILGDLDEMFARRAQRHGRWWAARRYLWDTLASAVAGRLSWAWRRGSRRPTPALPHTASGHSPGFVSPSRTIGVFADVRTACRSLHREKGFTVLAVFTLALGIGTAAAVFGMVDQLLLRPQPGVHDDGRVAYMRFYALSEDDASRQHNLTTPELDEVRRSATLLDGIGSYGFAGYNVSAGDGSPIGVSATMFYGDYFEVLGVRPAAGRLLRASDTDFTGDPLRAVLSQRLADALFSSATAAIGKTIQVNAHAVTVVGVAGGGFRGCQRNVGIDLWLPLGAYVPLDGFPLDKLRGRSGAPHGLFVVRLRTGVSVAAADAQLTQELRPLARAESSYDHDARLAHVEPRLSPGLGMPPDLRPRIESSLRLFAGAVTLVLLIACANVANLLLFRNVARRRAVTTRRALGASAGRIAREHMIQSLLLGMLGAAAGVGVGWILSYTFRGQSLGRVPAFHGLALDGRVALFAVLAAIVTALLFGTLPAALVGRFDLAVSLRQMAVQHSGSGSTFRSALAAGQLALTLVLGVGALLLVRTVHNLNTADTGLDVHGVASMFQSHSVNMTRAQGDILARRLLAALDAVPGVESAAMGPYDLDNLWGSGMGRVGPPGTAEDKRVTAHIVPVSPSWFRIFRITPLRGRLFDEDDWKEREPYDAVLTTSLARRVFGTGDAVGRTLAGMFGRPELHVIGVVPNLSGNAAPDVPKEAAFVTYDYPPVTTSAFPVVVRARSFDTHTRQAIRKAAIGILPDQSVQEPVPISAAAAHREPETLSHLLLLLSALAATLAAVGLYGIIAFVVAGRRREFGIRLVLGADASRLGGLVIRYGALIVGVGTLLGLAGAYALSRILRSRLFGVGMLDPVSYVGAAGFLALVAVVACWIPAWRAMGVDPVTTLREE